VSKNKKRTIVEEENYWEEIFNDIEMTFFPIEYISKIIIKFQNNTTWDIDIDDSRKKQPIEQIEETLDQLFIEYEDQIENIDFKLNSERIKHDLSRRVYKFLKLHK